MPVRLLLQLKNLRARQNSNMEKQGIYTNFVKRALDFLGASILFVLTLPLLIVIAIIIKLESRGPVFYRQLRTGLHGEDFICYKFRSTPPSNNVYDKSKDDVYTVSGKFLRRFSLDELPQLIHVIRGEMSFIGPRPWITEYYRHMTPEQRRRASVRPGITGLAQAYGRNNLTIHEKIAYDLEYIDDLSFSEDVKVVLVTLKSIFDESAVSNSKGGIHAELDILRSQFSGREAAYGNTRIEDGA